MITLHLLRHGETIWHTGGRYAGSSDVPLTAHGQDQARALADWGRTAGLTAVVTSDLSRAVFTGAEVARGAGIAPREDARLREVDFGQAEGLTHEEMHEKFPAALEAFLERPATSLLPGAESGEAALRRALDAVVDLTASVPDDATVAIVAHGTIIRLLLCWMLGIPIDDYRRRFPTVENTALTTVQVPVASNPAGLRDEGALVRFNCRASA